MRCIANGHPSKMPQTREREIQTVVIVTFCIRNVWKGNRVRDTYTTLLEVFGLCLVVVGIGRFDVTLGIIAAGLVLVGLGYLLGRG